FRNGGYESSTMTLSAGYSYKFTLFEDNDPFNMFDTVKDVKISYYSGTGEEVLEQESWIFKREALGIWRIIEMSLP
ncbi:MAG TPA: hypothetical protein PKH07_15560, partial [bacterium]|nr:hypothetical protein [bacterium]